jgi:hypothetical protein
MKLTSLHFVFLLFLLFVLSSNHLIAQQKQIFLKPTQIFFDANGNGMLEFNKSLKGLTVQNVRVY